MRYELAGVACGDAGDTVCDNADTCKGGENTCLPNWEPATTECRGEVGLCDVAESCTGSAKECPADAYELAGVACGDAGDTVCDNADTCKGGENTCLPNWEPATTECRGEVGLCDVAESCTGSAKECPADAYELAGVACGDAGDTVCDNADTCKGGENTCLPNWEPATTECRGEVGLCDVAESCTGSAKECPADAYELAGVACGDAGDTVCDNADTCKGGENTCLPNWEPATTECRGEVGLCDVAESCTGSAKECPADAYELAGVACGDAGDTVCDNADTCKGGENTCLPNWEPATTECRPATIEQCDVAEQCTGSSSDCPVDMKKECALVTSSELCVFDTGNQCGADTSQFNLNFSPAVDVMPGFKANSTNPGQFYFNTFAPAPGEEGNSQSVTFTVPWPFVTQGAQPVHIYDGAASTLVDGCFSVPGWSWRAAVRRSDRADWASVSRASLVHARAASAEWTVSCVFRPTRTRCLEPRRPAYVYSDYQLHRPCDRCRLREHSP